MRKISGPKRDEVKGGLRKVHNKDIYIIKSSRATSRVKCLKYENTDVSEEP
jgi:hypothetical protein